MLRLYMGVPVGGGVRAVDRVGTRAPGLLSRIGCFEEGTLVIAEDGFVEIQDVKSGDLVWSYDETTGEVDLREVVAVSVRETGLVVHVHVVGGDRISTTNEHPFWVDGIGWRNAGELTAGDELVRLDGGTVQVEYLEVERRHTTVYNLEIEGYGTYFVAEPEVLVHNSFMRGLFRRTPATQEAMSAFGEAQAITLGRGARHLAGTGVGADVVEAAIVQSMRQAIGNASMTGSFWGRVQVQGLTLE